MQSLSMLRVSASPPPRDCAVYCGFDPTAASLHVGHLLTISALLHCRQSGLHPIAVVGGATGRVGDPSGRVTEREEVERDNLRTNAASIIDCLERIFHNDQKMRGAGPDIRVVDNWSWWKDVGAVEFVSDIARPFRVASMLAKESVSQRMSSEEGMSCAEFLYPLFQAFDFLHLHTKHNCWLQVGGGDQWGNITSGCEFVRKKTGHLVHGVTVPLLTTSSGDKLGKTAGNAVWLTGSSYPLYQFLLQTGDHDVATCLHRLTSLPPEEVDVIMQQHTTAPESFLAQKRLAEEVTRLVHGAEGLTHAETATKALFGDHHSLRSLTSDELLNLFSHVPTTQLNFDHLSSDTTVSEIAVQAKVVKSEFAVHQLLSTGGLYVNGDRVAENETFLPSLHMLPGNLTVFRVGKKTHHLIQWTH
ncbi:Tyrosine--tRNA ligase, mitochondrial [Geodia barretti]|uniref:Tyrosine--tRNA ligase n=1 Tax=Geodia barretti TaxID=519541 RepID=A0AA35SR26_GEOBA|nr:Tyrosine--tRNA ligase, mitochondrial [Geodia barretti]